MERPNVESKRSKMASHWGGSRDPGIVDIGQTEYITRLTSLRDSLIDQEQLYLAQALDRLRIHSLSNKTSSYRLRMNGDDVSKSPPPTQRRNMVTTVEKFRQMRPKRQNPVILPLQGKQLLDRGSQERPPSKEAGSSIGNNTSRSLVESSGIETDRSSSSKVDETVQNNLQRLIQPTSSIPNIGRKALKAQEHLELKTKSMANMKSRIYKQTGRQLASPFLTIQEVTAANSPMSPFPLPSMNVHNSQNQLQYNGPSIGSVVASGISPLSQRQQRGPASQNDPVDMDRTDASHYYENYINTNRPESHERTNGTLEGSESERGHSREGGRKAAGSRTPQSSSSRRIPQRRHPASFRQARYKQHPNLETTSENDDLGYHGNGVSYSIHRLTNGNGNAHDYSNGGTHHYMSDSSPSITTSGVNGTFYSTGEESEADVHLDHAHTRLPAIRQGEGAMHTAARAKVHRSNGGHRRSSHETKPSGNESSIRPTPVVVMHNTNGMYREISGTDNEFGLTAENSEHTTHRKHIVVDMPSIIFNAPSPAPDRPDEDDNVGQRSNSGQGQSHDPQASLKKTMKQQELRKRELTNLLEDVKELNMRSEALSSQSMNDDPPQ